MKKKKKTNLFFCSLFIYLQCVFRFTTKYHYIRPLVGFFLIFAFPWRFRGQVGGINIPLAERLNYCTLPSRPTKTPTNSVQFKARSLTVILNLGFMSSYQWC